MIQRGQDARFALEPRAPFSIARECGWQDLDGDLAAEFCIARSKDPSHSTRAQQREDPIAAHLAPDQIESCIAGSRFRFCEASRFLVREQ
jgi:hypothetical protein